MSGPVFALAGLWAGEGMLILDPRLLVCAVVVVLMVAAQVPRRRGVYRAYCVDCGLLGARHSQRAANRLGRRHLRVCPELVAQRQGRRA